MALKDLMGSLCTCCAAGAAAAAEGSGGGSLGAASLGMHPPAASVPTPSAASNVASKQAAFAASDPNNRRSAFYKTRLCFKFMETGSCGYGDRCNYAHGPQELVPGPGARAPHADGESAPTSMLPMVSPFYTCIATRASELTDVCGL